MADKTTDTQVNSPAPAATPEGVGGEGAGTLEHSAGGVTTRADATDLGVPMLPGQPGEPTGPEDALGKGATRGDYSNRIGPSNYQPTEVVAVVDAKPGEAQVVVEAQRDRVEQGDEPGKGGVSA